jgi:hypothetical protein
MTTFTKFKSDPMLSLRIFKDQVLVKEFVLLVDEVQQGVSRLVLGDERVPPLLLHVPLDILQFEPEQ